LGSIGHSFFAENLRRKNVPIRIKPVIKKTEVLCSENQINCGKTVRVDTSVDPRPRVTKRAGRAQQMSVLIEPKSESQEINFFILLS
jgi:hypothetical protein